MKKLLSCLCLLALAGGCDDREGPDTSKPSRFGFQTSIETTLVEEGRVAYGRYCVGCHGDTGDGSGEAAAFLNPRPRNFQLAKFKFSSTRSGQLPTDADLKRTLRDGLRGSAMPSFGLLPERTLDALIAYLKTFSPKWKERDPAPTIPMIEDPYRLAADKSDAIRRGEAIYHGYSVCWTCHPAYVPEARVNEYLVSFGAPAKESFRPNLYDAEGKPNEEGELIYPPDFLRDFVKAGVTTDDLYRSIAAGISGTAMPTWIDSMTLPGNAPGDPPLVKPEDLWAVAYYVQDLIAKRPPRLAEGRFTVRLRPRPIFLHGAPPPPAPTETAAPVTTQPVEFEAEFES